MRKTLLLAIAALAANSYAGGFLLLLGNPEANPEAQKAHAVLVVQAAGCHDPAAAKVTATAVGKDRRIPLQVVKLSTPGSFAIAQQWPSDGKWVIELEGNNGEQQTHTIVSAGPNGIDRLHAKFAQRAFTPSEVASLLE
jgi:hypothetical protein